MSRSAPKLPKPLLLSVRGSRDIQAGNDLQRRAVVDDRAAGPGDGGGDGRSDSHRGGDVDAGDLRDVDARDSSRRR